MCQSQRRGHDGQVKQGEQEVLHARDSVGRHATLPQSWIQRENWEFETHSYANTYFLQTERHCQELWIRD